MHGPRQRGLQRFVRELLHRQPRQAGQWHVDGMRVGRQRAGLGQAQVAADEVEVEVGRRVSLGQQLRVEQKAQ